MYVEFLIAFLPVYVFFLCLLQLALLFSARLILEHAALNTARAAAVVMGDDPKRYGDDDQDKHKMTEDGERRKDIRKAAIISLTPLILTGLIQEVKVEFPESDKPFGPDRTGTIEFKPITDETADKTAVEKIRVRLEVTALCKIGFANRIACPGLFEAWVPEQFTLGIWGEIRSVWMPKSTIRAEAVYPYQGARYVYEP